MSNPTPSQADKFIGELLSNPDFRSEVETAGSPDALSTLLMARGYQFTPEEWEAARNRAEAGINDDELENVVGGRAIPSSHPGTTGWDAVKQSFEAITGSIGSLFR